MPNNSEEINMATDIDEDDERHEFISSFRFIKEPKLMTSILDIILEDCKENSNSSLTQSYEYFKKGLKIDHLVTHLDENSQFEDYLERLIRFGQFPDEVYVHTYLLYNQCLKQLFPFFEDLEQFRIKVIGCCLYISQKILLDKNMKLLDFSYLLGFKCKKIKTIELIICEILNYEFKYSKKAIDTFLKDCKEKLSTLSQKNEIDGKLNFGENVNN